MSEHETSRRLQGERKGGLVMAVTGLLLLGVHFEACTRGVPEHSLCLILGIPFFLVGATAARFARILRVQVDQER